MPMVRAKTQRLAGNQRAGERSRKKLTAKEITFAAYRAGFGDHDTSSRSSMADNPTGIIIAVAIALAESRGRVGARGGPNSDGSYDLGLWQINTAAHVDKGFRFDAARLLTDPDYNAQAAKKVYEERYARDGIGWTAWSAYRNKSYLAFKPRAQLAAKAARLLTPEGDYSSNLATAIDDKARDMNPLNGFDFDGLADALWPILLKTAMAGTGLALIGYGIKALFGSTTAVAAKTTAPAAAATAASTGGSS